MQLLIRKYLSIANFFFTNKAVLLILICSIYSIAQFQTVQLEGRVDSVLLINFPLNEVVVTGEINQKSVSESLNTYIVISNKDIHLKDEFEIVNNKEIFKCNFKKSSEYLLLFENDLNQKSLKLLINQYKKAYIIFLNDEDRQLKISNKVIEFKKRLINEFSTNFKNVEVVDSLSINSKLKDIKKIDLIYPCVGDNNDFINRFKVSNNKTIKNLVRDEDLYSWQFASKGFFRFKKDIPSINNFLFQKKRLW